MHVCVPLPACPVALPWHCGHEATPGADAVVRPLQTKELIETVLPFDATTFNIAKLRSGAA